MIIEKYLPVVRRLLVRLDRMPYLLLRILLFIYFRLGIRVVSSDRRLASPINTSEHTDDESFLINLLLLLSNSKLYVVLFAEEYKVPLRDVSLLLYDIYNSSRDEPTVAVLS